MLLRMLKENMPIDEIIFCDTYKEFPQMYQHIEKVNQYNIKMEKARKQKKKDYFSASMKLLLQEGEEYRNYNYILE